MNHRRLRLFLQRMWKTPRGSPALAMIWMPVPSMVIHFPRLLWKSIFWVVHWSNSSPPDSHEVVFEMCVVPEVTNLVDLSYNYGVPEDLMPFTIAHSFGLSSQLIGSSICISSSSGNDGAVSIFILSPSFAPLGASTSCSSRGCRYIN